MTMKSVSKILVLSVLFVWISGLSMLHVGNNPVRIANMKVEYAETPLGIDVEKPRFSWQMEVGDHERGYSQTAWQMVVSDEKGKQVWDSGKHKSDVSLNIEYAGATLQPATRYSWKLNIWNQKDEETTQNSWFETGLISADHAYQGWDGAKWIGGGG